MREFSTFSGLIMESVHLLKVLRDNRLADQFNHEFQYLEKSTSNRKEKYSKQFLNIFWKKLKFCKGNQIFMMATYLPRWRQWQLNST